jgi:hypothetical protein
MDILDRLAVREAISEGKARYCRYLDTKCWTQFSSLFTEDFELDVSDGTGLPVIQGREAAVEQIRSSIDEAVTVHQVHQPEMQFGENEVAVTWAMQDRVIWSADRPSLVGYGHYHERWVLREGEWKIASLKLTRLNLEFLSPQP